MEAREFGIGNITHNHRIVKEIYEDSVKLDNGITVNMIALQPENLTEEWLVRFGFEKETGIENEYHREDSDYDVAIVGGKVAFIISDPENHPATKHYICHSEFVHEFQNSFYALNKKELTIKETATA